MAAAAGELTWHGSGKKRYEMGVSKGVLYKYNSSSTKWEGVAWNGLISVTESPDGAEETELWADNIKYGSFRSAEKFGGSIEAYTYPDEFESCDGLASLASGISIGQQTREKFCLCYRTEIGDDVKQDKGYRLHLVYNATCSPSEKAYETINDSPDAITFSWDFDTVPVAVEGHKDTSYLTIDSTTVSSANMTKIEKALYGQDAGDGVAASVPYIPMPDDLLDLLA